MDRNDFRTFAEFIGKIDRAKLALVCNVSKDTTYVWANRNMIPREKWPELQTSFDVLTLEKLYTMEAASRQGK